MSEYINNTTRRKAILKEVLASLHAGQSIEAVQAQFGELAKEASAAEIAEVEQMLINEGLPPSEIQRLCDVHVAVFRAGLDDQRPPHTIPGHPLHTFMLENAAILSVAEDVRYTTEALLDGSGKEDCHRLRSLLDTLAKVDVHYARKEYLLFPFMEHYGFKGPSTVMWGIHDQVRAGLREAQAASLECASFREGGAHKLLALLGTVREMIYKEEKILFPAALERLKEADWIAIHEQEGQMGYFEVSRGDEWRPQPITIEQIHAPAGDGNGAAGAAALATGLMQLNTGVLGVEQVDLMLRNLPVDITFVDENDEVRYFSQSKDRIFERTAAIIGRKVQNCHPPQSVDRVQRILEDFRANRRDEAEFWIKMGPRFVLIRYYAMRDAAGAYRGTLEVTQDIAPLRALEGERRLLDG